MIRAYFAQKTLYYSASKGEMLFVYSMNPRYAENAAAKLLREADLWAKDAGVDVRHPALWMTTMPLFGALVERAGL